jgi:hypothetical protein
MIVPTNNDNLNRVQPLPTSQGATFDRQSFSDLSVTSTNRATALDVCYTVYGDSTPSTSSLDDLYEDNAGMPITVDL